MPPQTRPRVLVTRTREQSSTLAEHLRALGLDPILIPTIELAPPTSFCALDAAFSSIRDFDWLLFTSANAVAAFTTRARALRLLVAPPGLAQRIAAIGPATAATLREQQLPPDLMPPFAVAESLAEALLPHARIPPSRENPGGRPARMLLVRAEQARDILHDALAAAGAALTIAPAYRNVIPPGSVAELRALFAHPAQRPAAITFTSSSTARNLLTLLAEAGLDLPPSILRISIGPVTSETLRSLGHPAHAEAPVPTIPALAETVLRALQP